MKQKPAGGVAPAKVSFFPFRENFVDHPAPQPLVRDGHGVRLEVKLVEPVPADVKEVAGLLVAESSWPSHAGRKAVEIAMPVVAALPAIAAPVGAPAGEAGASLALALVFALAGGFLLNLDTGRLTGSRTLRVVARDRHGRTVERRLSLHDGRLPPGHWEW